MIGETTTDIQTATGTGTGTGTTIVETTHLRITIGTVLESQVERGIGQGIEIETGIASENETEI